jgi:hypothetical protein
VSFGDDRLCDQEWMIHPLKYLRAKRRRRYQEENQAEIQAEESAAGTSQNRPIDVAESNELDDSS